MLILFYGLVPGDLLPEYFNYELNDLGSCHAVQWFANQLFCCFLILIIYYILYLFFLSQISMFLLQQGNIFGVLGRTNLPILNRYLQTSIQYLIRITILQRYTLHKAIHYHNIIHTKTHKKHKYYGQDEVKCGHVFIHFLHLGQNETTIGFLVVGSMVLSSFLSSFSWSVSSKWKSLLSTLSCPSCPCSPLVFSMLSSVFSVSSLSVSFGNWIEYFCLDD